MRYTFTKRLVWYGNNEGELAGISVTDGKQHHDFFESTVHTVDRQNQSNLFASINKFVDDNLKTMKIDTNMAPAKMRHKLDFPHLYKSTDAKIEKYFQEIADFWKKQHIADDYYNITQKMSNFTPVGVEAMLTGMKYPRWTAVFDFFRFVDRENIQNAINALPKEKREEMLKFAKEHNFNISHSDWRAHGRKQSKQASQNDPEYSDFTKKNFNNIIMRAAVTVLADRLKWEYYKKTKNFEIFFDKADQTALNALSDEQLAKIYGPGAVQYFENALVVKQRIEKIIAEKRDISPFLKQLRMNTAYYNQDIIKLLYDSVKHNYSKFSKSKDVVNFVRALYEVTKDPAMKKNMRETFGLKNVYEVFPSPKQDIKKTKVEKRKNLADAADRIRSGGARSGVVIADDIARLYDEYGLAPVDRQKTVEKLQAKKPLNKAQQQIVKRYATNKR